MTTLGECLALLLILTTSPVCAQERAEVLMETTEGNIRIALYNETPLHRDNFLKIVGMQLYDSLLFHRVIKDFMVQSGDLNSKHAKPGVRLGTGELDYTTEAEIRLPQLFHRRGVIAAAREGDKANPERRSGACQFYIVWGKKWDDTRLAMVQDRLDTLTWGTVKITPEMAEVYKTVGGTPHLDGQYTVFGEIIEGLDVIDRIQQMPVDKYDRPLADVRILRAAITKNPFSIVPKPEKKKQISRRKQKK